MFLNLVRRDRIPPELVEGELRFSPAHIVHVFLKSLRATKKKSRLLMKERDERLAKGEDIFLMRTLYDIRKTREHPLNRATRRYRARLMNRFLRGALRRQLRTARGQQAQVDKAVNENFEQRGAEKEGRRGRAAKR